MTALRLVGTFFLVVCGWCAGDAVCIRTQEHLEALRQTIALLEEIEQEITSVSYTHLRAHETL